MNQRSVQRADCDAYDALNPVFRIQTRNDKLFLVIGRMYTLVILEEPLGLFSDCDARAVLK
jgi:hypothetical protein